MKSRSALVALGVTILVALLLAAISLAHHLGFSTVERLMRDPAFSAGAALATAVLLDLLPTRGLLFPGASGYVLAEDGAKLLGLFLWATYLIRIAGATLRNARRSTAAPPATAVPRSDSSA